MHIRPYEAGDDAALMQIEYRSPRGETSPFVHYRRRFADRAALFPHSQLLSLEQNNEVIGCIAAGFKQVQVAGEFCSFAYLFDLRVKPEYRRQGCASMLIRAVEQLAGARGAVALYGSVVSTNLASLATMDVHGFQRIRQLLYLEYAPVAECAPAVPVEFDADDDLIRFSPLADRDFYTLDVQAAVTPYAYQRCYHDSDNGFASVSSFDLSQVYRQIALEDLHLPPEVLAERSRSLRLFNLQGLDAPALFQSVFESLRYRVVNTPYQMLSLVIDAEETAPYFIFEQALRQKRYWVVFKPLDPSFAPEWSSPFYIDPREV